MLPDARLAVAAAADALSVSIEEIRHIANTTFADMQDDARTKAEKFSKADVGDHAFTSYPLALELARQHRAAVAVFTQTMDGVQRDLKSFQDALLDSAKEYEAADDAAAAAMAAVDHRFGDQGNLATQQRFDDARHEQGDALETDSVEQSQPAASTGADSDSQQPSADPYQ